MRHRFPYLLVGLLACRDPATARDIHARLVESALWSGAEVRVVSQQFRPPVGVFAVLLDSDTLPYRRVDDTTIAARLPEAPGEYQVWLAMDGQTLPLGEVRLAGFRDQYEGPYIYGTVLEWPVGGPPKVIGTGDSGAVLVDLTMNTAVPLVPDSVHSGWCAPSVGRSARPNHFVFAGKRGLNCRITSWSLAPGQPTLADSFPWSVSGSYLLAELGTARWSSSSDSYLYLYDCRSGGCTTSEPPLIGNAHEMVFSPAANRAVPLGSWGDARVFDPNTMDTAYTLPGFHYVLGAAFTATGDTLFVTTQELTGYHDYLLRVNSGTGAVTATVRPEDFYDPDSQFINVSARNVAIDPVNPWLYVSGQANSDGAWRQVLFVVDRGSLEILTMMKLREGFTDNAGRLTRIVPSPLEHLVYVVETTYPPRFFSNVPVRAHVTRFDMPH